MKSLIGVVRWAEMRMIFRPILAVRLAVLPFGVAATVLLPNSGGVVLGLIVLATGAAVIAPARVGALPLLVVEVLAWTFEYGVNASPPTARTVLFAVSIYLIHVTTSLAASVEWSASLDYGILRGWAIRCIPGVSSAIIVGLVLGELGSLKSAIGLDIAGLLAVGLIVVAIDWLLNTRL